MSTVSRPTDTKLNHLQTILPEGVVFSSHQLSASTYSRQLVQKYVAGGWLLRLGRGAYRRPGAPLKWENVAYSLQQMKLPFYPGGETALGLVGRAHQLPASGRQTVHIYGSAKLPLWVAKAVSDVRFRHHAEELFDEPPPFWSRTHGSTLISDPTWEPYRWGAWDWNIHISCAERAWLEFLQDVPAKAGFDEADELASGLRTLRPKLMEALLGRCTSFKVKRLAFWLGERHHHAWVSKINRESISLGEGKRSLAPGGRLIKRYNITVPRHLASDV